MLAPVGMQKIKNDKKTIDFNFIMYTPQDELSYTITIKNTGTLNAKIEDIITYPNYLEDTTLQASISPITITHNDLDGKTLEPEDELEIKLVVSYNIGNNVGQASIPYQMTILATSTDK